MSPGLICWKLRTSGPATTSTVLPLAPRSVIVRVAWSTAVTWPEAVVSAAPITRADAAIGIASVPASTPAKARRATGAKTDFCFFMVMHPPGRGSFGGKRGKRRAEASGHTGAGTGRLEEKAMPAPLGRMLAG
ncbi:hypothetical protein D3C72_1560730 [compost metagenome]